MNAIVIAIEAAKSHVKAQLDDTPTMKENRRKELNKLKKAELIDLLLIKEKFRSLKIEDLAKPILEDPKCAWLDYASIAAMIKEVMPEANTSSKSLASYASKYPKQKGWVVQPRKSVAACREEILNLINL